MATAPLLGALARIRSRPLATCLGVEFILRQDFAVTKGVLLRKETEVEQKIYYHLCLVQLLMGNAFMTEFSFG